jgi:hypothetical protein
MTKINAIVIFELPSEISPEDYQIAIDNILDGRGYLKSFYVVKP